MLGELIESRRRSALPLRQSLCSFALHIGLVLGAIGATRSPVRAPAARPVAIGIIYEAPPRPAAVIAAVPASSTPVASVTAPAIPAITVPVLAPADLPPVSPGTPVDPKRLAAAIRGGAPLGSAIGGPPDLAPGGILLPAEADRAPELVPGARCAGAYPAALRAMGVGGRAVLQFVVGVDGRVDSASVRIESSSHPAFGAAARDGVLSASCRYRPGEYHGQPVRVLVQQAAAFRLGE